MAEPPTLDALIQALATLGSPKPQCVAIFIWSLSPLGNFLQFSAPIEPAALDWLGPYAPDIREELASAHAGDFVWLIHPRTLFDACPPHPNTGEDFRSPSSFSGVPVRELRRDPEWAPPPLIGTPWAESLAETSQVVDEALERLRSLGDTHG